MKFVRNSIFYITLLFYFLGPVAFFVAQLSNSYGWDLTFLEKNISFYQTTQNYFLSIILGVLSLLFGYAFYKGGVLKYRVSDISGIFGILIALLSLCFIPFFPIFSWVFMFAGFLCLYSTLVPLVSKLYEKMKGNDWEKGAVTAFFAYIIWYFCSYESNILLSNIFAVDPKHFPYTQLIGGIVVLSPLIFFISFVSLCVFSWKLLTLKKSNEKSSFLFLNGMITSMFLFIFSLAFASGGTNIIKNVASVVDFNPNSFCEGVSDNEGVIYLDPTYNLILVTGIDKEGEHSYIPKICKQELNKEINKD
ncbi:hypothetical protein [Pseudoalteromonas sp. ECSMB14103]|uniref:hypothetical protein n=1 Tax=Pseudoalteromonas sp. ECSMB14103 TaxID=1580062 RepID=UPI00057A1E2C|nr:hypothetical protein [Pseudoalteromonas sp. ECSMB14103]